MPFPVRPLTRLLWLLSGQARLVLVILGLFSLGNSLAGLFVHVFIFKVSNGFAGVALFNLAQWAAVAFVFPPAAWVGKRWGPALCLRLGLAGYMLFYALTIVLGRRVIQYLVPLGVVLGTAVAIFSLGQHIITVQTTSNRDRDPFYNMLGFLVSVAGVLAPLAGGLATSLLPDLMGYRAIFGGTAALFTAAGLLSLRVRGRAAAEAFGWRRVLLPAGAGGDWWRVMGASVMVGFRDPYLFLLLVLSYQAIGSELGYAGFNVGLAVVALATYLFLARRLDVTCRRRYLFIGSVGMLASAAVLIWRADLPGLALHGLLAAASYPLAATPFGSMAYAVLGRLCQVRARDRLFEVFAGREIPLGFGRVLSIAVFLLMGPGSRTAVTYLVVLSTAYLVVWLLLRNVGEQAAAN